MEQSTRTNATTEPAGARAKVGIATISVAASAGAALVHVAAASAHGADGSGAVVVAFLAAAGAQLALPLLAIARGGQWWTAVAAVNLLAAAAYVAALLGWVPALHEGREAVTVLGVVAVALELAAAATALMRPASPWAPVRTGPAVVGAAIVVAAVTAIALTPAPAHLSDGHDHAAPAAQVPPDQQTRADALIASTKRELARFADVTVAESAGYRWIGDGAGPGGYRHYVNPALVLDPVVLDPAQVESLVYRTERAGTLTLVSAMFILPPGQTMADVPDVAGELTQWHEHTDLCWRPDGTVAGLVRAAGCPAGSTYLPTPPMLHVWVVENPAGPFAGIEGTNQPHGH